MQQEDRNAAPGRLDVVRAFVNTIDIEDGREELDSPERLRAWLAAHGLIPDGQPAADADLTHAIEVRESLRALLRVNNGEGIEPGVLDTLNRAGDRAPLRVAFDAEGSVLAPANSGVDAALALLLAIVHDAMVAGSWTRLKACRNHTCAWAFYDHSKNRSGAWCSMSVCGSRSKARTYRQRRKTATAG